MGFILILLNIINVLLAAHFVMISDWFFVGVTLMNIYLFSNAYDKLRAKELEDKDKDDEY